MAESSMSSKVGAIVIAGVLILGAFFIGSAFSGFSLFGGGDEYTDVGVSVVEKVRNIAELTTVEMVQTGSPCIIRVDGHKLCFRDGECFNVLVRLGAAG